MLFKQTGSECVHDGQLMQPFHGIVSRQRKHSIFLINLQSHYYICSSVIACVNAIIKSCKKTVVIYIVWCGLPLEFLPPDCVLWVIQLLKGLSAF